jgi:virulence-associated protein VapD
VYAYYFSLFLLCYFNCKRFLSGIKKHAIDVLQSLLEHTFHETQHSVRVDRRTCWQTEWQTLFLGILKQINFLEHSLQNLGSWLTWKLCESPCNFLFEMDNLFVYTSYLFIFFSQILICLFCCNTFPCRMLSSNNLSGNLPEELGGLKNLTDL